MFEGPSVDGSFDFRSVDVLPHRQKYHELSRCIYGSRAGVTIVCRFFFGFFSPQVQLSVVVS